MSQLRIYLVDDDLLYIQAGEAFAEEDPEVPGAHVVPWNGRKKEPPALGDHQAARSLGRGDEADWEVIPDWRGHTYWLADRTKVLITEIGVQPPADALPADPGPTPEQAAGKAKAEFVSQAQTLLDMVAKGWGYDNVFSACTYADEPSVPKFQAEGQALRQYRSQFWAAAYALNPGPGDTVQSLLAQLPDPPARPA
jgi:hypothetical protein